MDKEKLLKLLKEVLAKDDIGKYLKNRSASIHSLSA